MLQNFMLVLAGPTGVGKSALAEKLAAHIPAEIINMDVGQFYTPFSIGTAKPAWRDSPIPHHLFDILDEPKNFTVVDYRRLLLETLEQVWSRGALPIVVGGSAFYLRSLLFPPDPALASIAVEAVDDVSDETAWDALYAFDPERAQALGKQDAYRIKRALAIWRATGKKPSTFKSVYNPPTNSLVVWVDRNRDQLYERIDRRVLAMINEGWLDEARQILATPWEDFLLKKKLIGYDAIIAFLRNSSSGSQDEMLASIQKRTRNYAKRQIIFWRKLKKELASVAKQKHNFITDALEVNLTTVELDLYIKQLLHRIESVGITFAKD